MYARTIGFVLDALTPRKVTVSTYINNGPFSLTVAGLPEAKTHELRNRISAAIASSGFEIPPRRITVRLGSATSIGRRGDGLDFAIAVSILVASGQLDPAAVDRTALAGDLDPSGLLAEARGPLQIAEAVAGDPELDSLALSSLSAPVAACAGGVEILQLHSLAAIRYLTDGDRRRLRPQSRVLPWTPDPGGPDFRDVPASHPARRAAEVAVAGGHPLLLLGAGQDGHNFIPRRIPSLLPPLSRPEALEVLRIAGVVDFLGRTMITGRPFRAPAASVAEEEMFGGGSENRPGEVTLAHLGVLYLRNLTQFPPELVERVCLAHRSDGVRAGSPPRPLPASFLLVASAQPCQCAAASSRDYSPSFHRLAADHSRMQRLASAFDVVSTYEPKSSNARVDSPPESSQVIRARVVEARARQESRLGPRRTNRQMTAAEVEESDLNEEAVHHLTRSFPYPDQAAARLRVIRVARTIADLAEETFIAKTHVAEALAMQPGANPAT